jgi:3-dehydroquinate synthase class II
MARSDVMAYCAFSARSVICRNSDVAGERKLMLTAVCGTNTIELAEDDGAAGELPDLASARQAKSVCDRPSGGRCRAWFDARPSGRIQSASGLIARAVAAGYTGLVITESDIGLLDRHSLGDVLRVGEVTSAERVSELVSAGALPSRERAPADRWVILSNNESALAACRRFGFATCLQAHVVGPACLHSAIERATRHDYLLLRLRDPTNIPLELAIATLQRTNTVLINEIADGSHCHSALISLGIMEVGADGVMFSPTEEGLLDEFLDGLRRDRSESELRAGSQMMVVGVNGKTRIAPLGRAKIEVRPLRLVVAEFVSGNRVNVLLQDDWHVRIYSADRKPLHVTELTPGTTILAHEARPGRNVGISVDETILEN